MARVCNGQTLGRVREHRAAKDRSGKSLALTWDGYRTGGDRQLSEGPLTPLDLTNPAGGGEGMGAWGPGNFDSDSALDWYLIDLAKPLLTQMRRTVSSRTRLEPDEPDSTKFMCALEVLATLDRGLKPILPGREELKEWKARYLDVFDSFAAEEGDPSRFAARRRVVVKTFESAIRQARPGQLKANTQANAGQKKNKKTKAKKATRKAKGAKQQ